MSDLVTDGKRVVGAVGFNFELGRLTFLGPKRSSWCRWYSLRFDTRQLNNTGEGASDGLLRRARFQNLEQGGQRKFPKNGVGRHQGNPLGYAFGLKLVNRLGEDFMRTNGIRCLECGRTDFNKQRLQKR